MRTIDNASLGLLFALYSGTNFVHLVQYTHPNLGSPLYFCDDNVDLVSNGITYKCTGLEISIPIEDMTRQQTATITQDNTQFDMSAMINTCNGGIDGQAIICSIAIVSRNEPNTLIVPFSSMEMRQPQCTSMPPQMTCSLQQDEALDETIPGDTMNTHSAPGAFSASWYQQISG